MGTWGDVFKAIIPAVVTVGGGLIMNNQAVKNAQGQANAQQDALNKQYAIALQNEKNIKAMQQAGNATPDKEKSNTALYIGLGVGGVVILGVVIFAVTRRN
jgi:uncharacterized protein YllA (UPF0747 family)